MADLKLRIEFGSLGFLGPGKAELLERIAETGSISAAGRGMGMSYKRAWSLVDTLNAMFAAPLVDSTRGGRSGGGARLTDEGRAVLAAYRAITHGLDALAAPHVADLEARLAEDVS